MLSAHHLHEFDRALEWALMGTSAESTTPDTIANRLAIG
jgi:hypothetical protein